MNKYLLNMNFDDIKISSLEFDKYKIENNLTDNDKNFLLIKSIESGNFFIFDELDIENKNIFFNDIFNNIKLRQIRTRKKINLTIENNKDKKQILKNFDKTFKKINVKDFNYESIREYFLKILFFDELIDKYQLSKTVIL